MVIREVEENDLKGLLMLYRQLHDNPLPQENDKLMLLWCHIVKDKNHHIIVAEEDGKIVSSCDSK